MKIRKVLLVVKRSPIEELRAAKNHGPAEARLKHLLEEHHRTVRALQMAHEEHLASTRVVRRELRDRGIKFVERNSSPTQVVRGFDLVVSVGGDGTLLGASHAVLGKAVLLGVNSAPAFSVGFLTGCRALTFAQTLDGLLEDRITPLVVSRLKVAIGNRSLPEPVLNDVLFCHDSPAMTTRYRLIAPDGDETQRSSGVWISAPAGSTAAMRSAGGTPLPLTAHGFGYVVREPYAPPGSAVRFRGGLLTASQKLSFEVHTQPTSIFIDGSHRRYPLRFGDRITFSLHQKPLRLVRPHDPI